MSKPNPIKAVYVEQEAQMACLVHLISDDDYKELNKLGFRYQSGYMSRFRWIRRDEGRDSYHLVDGGIKPTLDAKIIELKQKDT